MASMVPGPPASAIVASAVPGAPASTTVASAVAGAPTPAAATSMVLGAAASVALAYETPGTLVPVVSAAKGTSAAFDPRASPSWDGGAPSPACVRATSAAPPWAAGSFGSALTDTTPRYRVACASATQWAVEPGVSTRQKNEWKALRPHQKYTYLERGGNRFGTVTLVRKGGGGGRGTASMFIGSGWSSTDPGAPSVLYGSSYIASAATCSTATTKPIGLTARLPNARASGVLASAPERAIADPGSAPPPGSAGLLADAPGIVSPTSGRWSRGPRPISPSSSPFEASVDSDGDGDSSNGRPSFLC
ncbi:uncharacterized protein [Miscanthus floridulus]|uniref:uncharacterized protein n=1 Tax=Miscanthus floridulus TaxID=154761 RepID=UPI00345791A5